jgi:tRNA-dihydrouridine synthase
LAPLQGHTEYTFRKAWLNSFDGIDFCISPYIEVPKSKNKQWTDIIPENNTNIEIIPQVLGSNAIDISETCKKLKDLGYKKVNINLGCPYPMAMNKGFGAALLSDPVYLQSFFENIISKIDMQVSIKTRIGIKEKQEFYPLMDVFNKFNFDFIAIHPRTASQMYKGNADLDFFHEIKNKLKHQLIYNGDIHTDNYPEFTSIKYLMLGRGLLINPFLPLLIKGIKTDDSYRRIRLKAFYNNLLLEYSKRYCGERQVLSKLLEFWNYHALYYNDSKLIKKIKKCKTLTDYIFIVNKLIE